MSLLFRLGLCHVSDQHPCEDRNRPFLVEGVDVEGTVRGEGPKTFFSQGPYPVSWLQVIPEKPLQKPANAPMKEPICRPTWRRTLDIPGKMTKSTASLKRLHFSPSYLPSLPLTKTGAGRSLGKEAVGQEESFPHWWPTSHRQGWVGKIL